MGKKLFTHVHAKKFLKIMSGRSIDANANPKFYLKKYFMQIVSFQAKLETNCFEIIQIN